MHICFEGIDGTGKTTLSKAVKAELENLGKKVVHTSEPGNINQKCSMSIRDLILNKEYENDIDDTEREYLLALNRRIQYKKSQSFLKEGNIVVQDRGWMSGFAYSQAKGFSLDEIDSINEKLTPNFKNMFDVIIYLNNNKNIEETLQKAQEAKQEFESGDTIEAKGASFQQAVRDNYVNLVKKFEKDVYIIQIDIYDGTRRLTTEELVGRVMKIVKKKVLMFVGNSGSGKSTLESMLVNKHPHLFSRVISYTTRPIDKVGRKEVDGKHYHFINNEKYDEMLKNGEFIQVTDYGQFKYASSHESYNNKTPYTIVVIAPEKGKVLADELEAKGFEVQWVLFDISNEKIKENLMKEGQAIEEIEKRFNREDNKEKFNSMNLVANIKITDNMLNETLVDEFLKKVHS